MSEFMPHYAPVAVLLFLGTVLLMGASFLVLFYGAARRSLLEKPPAKAGEVVTGFSTPLTTPLRPGESYTTDFVFDVPRDARGLRLSITEDDPETRLVIGHENSLFHKKIYLGVDSAASLTKSAR
jgi:hypothetical protein